MVNPVNLTLVNALFGGASASGPIGLDASLLTSIARARAGIGVDVANAGSDPNAPIAPVWTPGLSPAASVLVKRALDNKPFFDLNAKLYSDLGANGDYKRLFALYSGLTTLQALAGRAEDDELSSPDRNATLAQFSRGLSELSAFFSAQQFEDIRLAQGDRVDAAQTTMSFPTRSEDFSTGYIHRGGLFDTFAGLDRNAQFTITATSSVGVVRTVEIDLAEMGSIPRTFGNVISHINGRLAAEGAASRFEPEDLTPKENTILIAGRPVTTRYTGPKQYGLKVDVRAGETLSLSAPATEPAFYALGSVPNGARLIKLSDVGGEGGQPTWAARPEATLDPIGPHVADGWFGPGAPYTAPSASAWEQRTNALASTSTNVFETALRAAGDVVLKLETPDGRAYSVSTAWRAGDQEAWRVRSGEDGDRALLDDLAERLTQLLHEQGLAAGVDVWEDSGSYGFSIYSGDRIKVSSLAISGRPASLENIALAGMNGGLRSGVFARRFEAAAVAATNDVFIGTQTLSITTSVSTRTVSVDGGEAGLSAAALEAQFNEQLRGLGMAAAVSFHDDGGALALRIDGLHETLAASATLNAATHETVLQDPGAWASGGLPVAAPGAPFADAIRTTSVVGASPLLTHTGALNLEIVVDTPTGARTVSVAVGADERAANPDPSPGVWDYVFQARLQNALNAAGLYVSADGGDLTQWRVAEDAGQRLQSVSINGVALALDASAPPLGLGGAHSVERSFTTALAATGVSDIVSALQSDGSVSISFDTFWGARTVSAALEPGDAATLESAALRLNQALAAQGYDIGVVATALSGGGAGLRIVTGASHSVRTISAVTLGGESPATTLDPIDVVSRADDPPGAAPVADRAARGAAVTLTIPNQSTFTAPSANASNWFAGRAFDISIGGGMQVATARAVAAGPDGAAYVLADLGGDSATSAIKGARDVALLKYDSAGKLAFSRILGASGSASGFALAVAADGKIAIAGSIEGSLSNTGASGGGVDSFVTVFDAGGAEVWTARRGATANDQANAIAFAPDGGVIVAGRTEGAFPGQVANGGADGYVRGYSASGGELFVRQFGGGGEDAATALLVRDNGAGGVEIFTGGVENNRGLVRSFTYSASAGLTIGATRDLGFFLNGQINALAADGASLYVGGAVGADRLTLAATARASAAGSEGFVARIATDLGSTALDRATYLGSVQDDAVKSLSLVNGTLYAAGESGGLIGAQGVSGVKTAFVARLDAGGQLAWTRTFNSSGGGLSLTGMAAAPTGASALDALGLPQGRLNAADSSALVGRSALRAGDEFRIGVDGRRLTTIRVGAADTLASLAATINRSIGAAGRAEIVRENGVERLKIAARDGRAIEIDAGRPGRDALAALGLNPGVIARTNAGRGALKTYGLGLIAADLRLDSKTNIARAKAELSAAVSIIRQAYEGLLNPNAKELTPEEKALEERRRNAGPAPAQINAQLANYRAALARLGGG